MGYIYLIVCLVTNMKYVGQTHYEKPEERWNGHKTKGRSLIRKNNVSPVTKDGLYGAMIAYGIDQFRFEVLEQCEDDLLNERESYYIGLLGTLSPFGYNLTTGGSSKMRMSNDTRSLMSKLSTERAPKIVDKLRGPETQGLPMYVVWRSQGGRLGYAINGHPLCKHKKFRICGKQGYKTIEECKQGALTFLAELEAGGIAYIKPEKKCVWLPEGMQKVKGGYFVNKSFNGKSHFKRFISPNLSNAAKLKLAVLFYNSIPGIEPIGDLADPEDANQLTPEESLAFVQKYNEDGSLRMPRCIKKYKNGYRVSKVIRGIRFTEDFNSPKRSLQQNMEAAFEYYNSIPGITRVKVPTIQNDVVNAITPQTLTDEDYLLIMQWVNDSVPTVTSNDNSNN